MTILSTADAGASGIYCNSWAFGWRFRDFGNAENQTPATAARDTVDFTTDNGKRRFHFAVHADDPDAMTYTQERATGTKTLELRRPTDAACASRVLALDPG